MPDPELTTAVEHVPEEQSPQTQPIDPPIELSIAATAPPKPAVLNAEAPVWQTKTLTARKAGGRRSYAVKQVDAPAPTIPPGFEAQAIASGPVSKAPATFPSGASHLSANALPFSATSHGSMYFLPGRDAEPPAVFPSEAFHLSPNAGNGKVARRPAIKKKQSAGGGGTISESLDCLGTDSSVEAATRRDVSPISQEDSTHRPDNEMTGTQHSRIKPATLSELRHKFVDTSLLKKSAADEFQQTDPVPVSPLNPEEAARAALSAAFNERESTRKRLVTSYTQNCALEFDEKAKAYKARRQALAALMPSGCLSIKDDEAFPHLSTKDTLEPKVCDN